MEQGGGGGSSSGLSLQRRSRQSATRETKASLMTRQPWSRAREEEKKEASGRERPMATGPVVEAAELLLGDRRSSKEEELGDGSGSRSLGPG